MGTRIVANRGLRPGRAAPATILLLFAVPFGLALIAVIRPESFSVSEVKLCLASNLDYTRVAKAWPFFVR